MPVIADVEVSLNDSFETTGQDFPNRPATLSLMSETELFKQSLTFGACMLTAF